MSLHILDGIKSTKFWGMARKIKHTYIPPVLRNSSISQHTDSANRLNIISSKMRKATTYLEVGVQHGLTFRDVALPFRWGVDPVPKFNVRRLQSGCKFSSVTSDIFFDELNKDVFFDLIFLDGLHEWKQTYRDLMNSLTHLNENGVILIDDVVPDDEYSAVPDLNESIRIKKQLGIGNTRWQGDVFKVLLAIINLHPELGLCVIGEETNNAQALVWKNVVPQFQTVSKHESEEFLRIDALTYEDVFIKQNVQKLFNYLPEEKGIDQAVLRSV